MFKKARKKIALRKSKKTIPFTKKLQIINNNRKNWEIIREKLISQF